MKPFTPVAAFILCLLLTSSGKTSILEQALRAEIEKLSSPGVLDGYRIPLRSRRIYHTVPFEVASILESYTETDLISALFAIKNTATERDKSLVENWIKIVKSHVRGVRGPEDVSYALPMWQGNRP